MMSRKKVNMTPHEKMVQARITLLRVMPFFGTMCMRLKPIELTKEEALKSMPQATAGVDIYGNMPYCDEFINGLSGEEIMFVLAHECMHLCNLHLERCGTRDPKMWNVSADEATNNLLKHEMRIWSKALCSHQFEEMSSEEIYDELLKKENIDNVYGGNLPSSFDAHFYGKPDKGAGSGSGTKSPQSPFAGQGDEPIDVPRMIKDAASFAKGQGKMPAGMARLFKDLLEPKMNWKELLQKFIMSVLPQDWTYTRPSKRSAASGFYMPSIVKETVEIVIGVDTSGSISDEEYYQFLSEIYAMTRSVNNLRATVLFCDAAVSEIVEIDNNFDPARDIKARGYGGTSCIPIFRWLMEEKRENIRLLVYLTDGWIDEPTPLVYSGRYPVLWIITSKGAVDFLHNNIGRQQVIKMEGKDKNGKYN